MEQDLGIRPSGLGAPQATPRLAGTSHGVEGSFDSAIAQNAT